MHRLLYNTNGFIKKELVYVIWNQSLVQYINIYGHFQWFPR